MNVSLGAEMDAFVGKLVASGQYQSNSEVVREALRMLMERQQLRELRLTELRVQLREAREALERGEGIPAESVFEDLVALSAERRKGKKR